MIHFISELVFSRFDLQKTELFLPEITLSNIYIYINIKTFSFLVCLRYSKI